MEKEKRGSKEDSNLSTAHFKERHFLTRKKWIPWRVGREKTGSNSCHPRLMHSFLSLSLSSVSFYLFSLSLSLLFLSIFSLSLSLSLLNFTPASFRDSFRYLKDILRDSCGNHLKCSSLSSLKLCYLIEVRIKMLTRIRRKGTEREREKK